MAALPATVQKIESWTARRPGALGEPLYMDVINALAHEGRADLTVVGGRYGLASDTAVFGVRHLPGAGEGRAGASSPWASSTT